MKALPGSAGIADQDNGWIIALHQGDPAAVRELYEHFEKVLRYTSFRITKDLHASQDIVQEVFIKFYELRCQFETQGAIAKFLHIVVRNESINYCKSRKKRIDKAVDYALQESDWQQDTFSEMVMAEIRLHLYTIISRLPEQQREVIMSSVVEGKSAEKIAKEMNLSISNVRTIKHRDLLTLSAYAMVQKLDHSAFLLFLLVINRLD